jgi:hypothetical protein
MFQYYPTNGNRGEILVAKAGAFSASSEISVAQIAGRPTTAI